MKALKYTGMILALLLSPVSPSDARPPVDPAVLNVYVDAVPTPGSLPQVAIDLCDIDMYNTGQRSRSSMPQTNVVGVDLIQARAGSYDATVERIRGVEIQVHWTNYLPSPNVLYASADYTIVLADWQGTVAPDDIHLGSDGTGLESNRFLSGRMAQNRCTRTVSPRSATAPNGQCDVIIDLPAPLAVPAVDIVYGVEAPDPKATSEVIRPRMTPINIADNSTPAASRSVVRLPEPGTMVEARVSLVKLTVVPTLSQNKPNPFNPITEIEFYLPCAGHVELAVFNIAGERVCTLVDDTREAGAYRAVWDGTDDHGANVASGIYLYRLEAAKHTETKEMILLK